MVDSGSVGDSDYGAVRMISPLTVKKHVAWMGCPCRDIYKKAKTRRQERAYASKYEERSTLNK
jgi:hypothetical protein